MKYLLPVVLLCVACYETTNKQHAVATNSIDIVLDNWHLAAAKGRHTEYFSYFADSSSIFMGTDASERWTVAQFAPWAKPYFADGMAWNFKPFNRSINYASDSTFAWFDEELNTPNLGLCRGSGVLTLQEDRWKIMHYNLSVPIPNAIVYEVRDQILALDSIK